MADVRTHTPLLAPRPPEWVIKAQYMGLMVEYIVPKPTGNIPARLVVV